MLFHVYYAKNRLLKILYIRKIKAVAKEIFKEHMHAEVVSTVLFCEKNSSLNSIIVLNLIRI